MGAAARQARLDEATYLAAERDAETRHEFVDGTLFAMTGASRAHNQLATRLSARLFGHLDGGPGRVSTSDMKLRLPDGPRYYYPDIMVACSDPAGEPDAYSETSPVLVTEILSPSTESTDRREKRLAYQGLSSLIDYLIVSQETRSIERFTRDKRGWTHAVFAPGETIELASIGLDLSLDDVYTGVEMS